MIGFLVKRLLWTAATMWVVADRLARPAGSAAPFVAPSLLSKYLGQAQAA